MMCIYIYIFFLRKSRDRYFDGKDIGLLAEVQNFHITKTKEKCTLNFPILPFLANVAQIESCAERKNKLKRN